MGQDGMSMGQMPQEPALDQQSVDMQKQLTRDAKKAEI